MGRNVHSRWHEDVNCEVMRKKWKRLGRKMRMNLKAWWAWRRGGKVEKSLDREFKGKNDR